MLEKVGGTGIQEKWATKNWRTDGAPWRQEDGGTAEWDADVSGFSGSP